MKTNRLLTLAMAMTLAVTVNAQENIVRTFLALKTAPKRIVGQNISLDKDPVTGKKISQVEIYDFSIPLNDKKLITQIESAFYTDIENSYTSASGTTPAKNGQNAVSIALAVGNGKNAGVALGAKPNTNYIYACFLDPEDETRTYRYAYALEYTKVKKNYQGRIIKTYAMTLDARNKKTPMTGNYKTNIGSRNADILNKALIAKDSILANLDGLNDEKISEIISGIYDSSTPTTIRLTTVNDTGDWLSAFGIYSSKFYKNPNGAYTSTYASQIYNLCKKSKILTDSEKNLVADEVDRMSRLTKDRYTKMLFRAAIEALKE
ncbi:MAG: hypothetical protein J5918_06160 [Prevotella sp.]|nr:hypothetical protein [Prevotella sp.]